MTPGVKTDKQQENVWRVADGGWGWVCVCACAVSSALSRGIILTFTLIYPHLQIQFGTSAMATAWIYSTYVTSSMFSSSFAAAVINRFGCRIVSMCGSLLVTLGLVMASFASGITTMYLAFFLAGVGSGCTSTASPLTLNMYFDAHRAKATSFIMIGHSIGGFAFPPVISFLHHYYGLHGCLLILAGIVLHTVIAGAMYITPDQSEAMFPSFKRRRRVNETSISSNPDSYTNCLELDGGHVTINAGNRSSGSYATRDSACADTKVMEAEEVVSAASDVDVTRTDINSNIKRKSSNDSLVKKGLESDDRDENYHHSNSFYSNDSIIESQNNITRGREADTISSTVTSVNTLSDDICSSFKEALDELALLCGFRLLRKGTFVAFCLMMFAVSLSISMVNVIIMGFVNERGVTESQMSWILSLNGLVNIPCRLLLGVILDSSLIRKARLEFLGFIALSVALTLLLFPFAFGYYAIGGLYTVHVILSTTFVTSEAIMLADLAGPRRMGGGIGISRFIRGLAIIAGPTIGGATRDVLGTFMYGLFFAGGLYGFFVIVFEITLFHRRCRRRKTQEISTPC